MGGVRTHDARCHGWTDTLQRVAERIAQGFTNREMARIEFVTEHAAKEQVRRVREHFELEYDVQLLSRGDLARHCRVVVNRERL